MWGLTFDARSGSRVRCQAEQCTDLLQAQQGMPTSCQGAVPAGGGRTFETLSGKGYALGDENGNCKCNCNALKIAKLAIPLERGHWHPFACIRLAVKAA